MCKAIDPSVKSVPMWRESNLINFEVDVDWSILNNLRYPVISTFVKFSALPSRIRFFKSHRQSRVKELLKSRYVKLKSQPGVVDVGGCSVLFAGSPFPCAILRSDPNGVHGPSACTILGK
jgi:hypothetical protein